MKFFLQLLVITFLLNPSFIHAQKQSMLLPREYADLKANDISSLQQMLAKGISINAVDEKGNSLLMLAAYAGDMKKVKFLIASGADINQRNEKNFFTFGDTPMDYAIRGHQKEIVDLFLSLNVDVNAKFRKATSTIYKCGMTGNYEMLYYLLQKGVVISDADKINTMILALPYDNNALMRKESRQIIALLLQDLQVEADDLWRSSFLKRGTPRDTNKVETILAIQDSYKDTKKKQLAKQREQDSLKLLLETGQADTIRYRYTGYRVAGKDGTWKGEIVVGPRVDSVANRQGDKDATVSWILWGLTLLMVCYCCPKIVRHLYEGNPTYLFPYIATYLIGLWVFYSIFSCIYTNLDDMTIREHGEEKIAILENESRWTQYSDRTGYHTTRHEYYSFIFTGNDSIRIAVRQGNTRFDASDYPLEEDKNHIKVRYDSKTHKLSVDNERYSMQNLIRISFMCLLLLFILMLSWGVFNGMLDMIRHKWRKALESRNKKVVFDPEEYEMMPVEEFRCFEGELLLDTYWTFTSKEYLSKYDFIHDVKVSEEQNGAEPGECINPDRVLLEFPIVRVYFSNEFMIGEEGFYIEINSDNGVDITEGELLFKLHNQMIPCLDRFSEHVIGVILPVGYEENSRIAKCILMFRSELEGEDEEIGEE